jgi:hypothetical protein
MQLAWVAVCCCGDTDLSFVTDEEFSDYISDFSLLRKTSCFMYLIAYYTSLVTDQPMESKF